MAKKKSASSGPSRTPKAVTPKRQAAMDAYSKAFDRAPAAKMTIKAMTDAIDKGRVAAGRQAARREQVAGIFGADVSQARADAAAKGARQKFDKKVGVNAKTPPASPLTSGVRARHEWVAQRYRDAHATQPPKPSPISTNPAAPSKWNMQPAPERWAGPPRPPYTPSPAAPPAGTNWQRLNTGLAVYGTGIQVANAFNKAKDEGKSTGDAAVEAAKAGAVPTAIAAASPISKGAGHVATGAFELSKAAMSATGFGDIMFLNMMFAKTAAVSGAVGVLAKGVEIGANVVGRVAAPAVAAYGAYQGAKEDTDNPTRGAIRGAVRGLDPTSLFMARGFGERAVDAAMGQAPKAGQATPAPKRLSSDQQKQFATANADFGSGPSKVAREPAKGREYAGEFVEVTNANGTTFKRRNPHYGTAGEQ